MEDNKQKITETVEETNEKEHAETVSDTTTSKTITESEKPIENTSEEKKEDTDNPGDAGKQKENEKETLQDKQQEDAEQKKGLRLALARFRNMLRDLFSRVKHTIDRSIGRNRIPSADSVQNIDYTKANELSIRGTGRNIQGPQRVPTERRNLIDILYHGFARILLGKDAYNEAIKRQEETEKAESEKESAKKVELLTPEQNLKNVTKEEEIMAEKTNDNEAQMIKVEKENEIKQNEKEEMQGKINSLHKMINNDLEERYSNAVMMKESFFEQYTRHLSEKLSQLNHGEPVDVEIRRGNENLHLEINNKQDPFGGYPTFMGTSKIKIDLDAHLNIREAEGFVATRQLPDGRLTGNTIDVSETLGKYVVADLARVFRKDYNTSEKSFNITSRNEFEHELQKAYLQKDSCFVMDNISYTITPNENGFTLTSNFAEKPVEITMDTPETQKNKESYEKAQQELNTAKKMLETLKIQHKDLVTAYEKKEEDRKNAQKKVSEIITKANETKNELNKLNKLLKAGAQRSGMSPEEFLAMTGKADTLNKDKNSLHFKEEKASIQYGIAEAKAQQARNKVNDILKQVEDQEKNISALQTRYESEKSTYESASVQMKARLDEAYEIHTKSVIKERQDSIQAFEQEMTSCRNGIDKSLSLNDLNQILDESGKMSLLEALTIRNVEPEQDHDDMRDNEQERSDPEPEPELEN